MSITYIFYPNETIGLLDPSSTLRGDEVGNYETQLAKYPILSTSINEELDTKRIRFSYAGGSATVIFLDDSLPEDNGVLFSMINTKNADAGLTTVTFTELPVGGIIKNTHSEQLTISCSDAMGVLLGIKDVLKSLTTTKLIPAAGSFKINPQPRLGATSMDLKMGNVVSTIDLPISGPTGSPLIFYFPAKYQSQVGGKTAQVLTKFPAIDGKYVVYSGPRRVEISVKFIMQTSL